MINFISEKLKEIGEGLSIIDTKLGFKKFSKYIFLLLSVILILNFKTVAREVVEFVIDIQEDIHSSKMLARDELMSQLQPLLVEFRASSKADRILYFEYHNSKENMLGIPFKYFTLQLQNSRYGCPEIDIEKSSRESYNAGYITSLYSSLRKGENVYCFGEDDEEFRTKYPGILELTDYIDKSKTRVYVNIPGIHQPVGFVVLEWTEGQSNLDVEKVNKSINDFVPRINGLLISARKN